MIEDDKRNLSINFGRKANRACKSFQHAARHPKPNDECTSWAKCQGHWDLHTENAKWDVF